MITFIRMQLSDIFNRMKMRQKNIKLFAALLVWTGLTACHTNSLKDIDGNVYKTVTIGNQFWMAENLKTTRFNDGTPIPMVKENDAWAKLTTPAFSWYNNDSTVYGKIYGGLYNWYAVGTNKLCPVGWHVPTEPEWNAMTKSLGEVGFASDKLKEAGTTHWRSPNTGATNESGFTALPGGYRSFEGTFNAIGIYGYWWSSTEYNSSTVLFWHLRYKYNMVYKYRSEKYCGFSVRCVMDH
jgi:uncharacterized protein (TIGR02145 family)